jgi:hypothetical protein
MLTGGIICKRWDLMAGSQAIGGILLEVIKVVLEEP